VQMAMKKPSRRQGTIPRRRRQAPGRRPFEGNLESLLRQAPGWVPFRRDIQSLTELTSKLWIEYNPEIPCGVGSTR
jgi:hypothetical protein